MPVLPLLVATALVLSASACATPSGQKSSAPEGAAIATAGKAARGKAGSAKPQTGQPWWKLSQYSREEEFKPWVYGDVRPGRGLLSGGEDSYTLYRKGSGNSADPTKPTKVRR
ncbi:MAG: hypothetical protein OXC10_21555 [Rhodospirillaceae bacterium]|nr:hypothetical protein [Rhodospirillaceae bacterium]